MPSTTPTQPERSSGGRPRPRAIITPSRSCGTSIEGSRRQANDCGGTCRAAASRTRATERSSSSLPGGESGALARAAQNRTDDATEIVQWNSLSPDEQDRIEGLLARHADLSGMM